MKPTTLIGEPSALRKSKDPLGTGLMSAVSSVECERMNFKLMIGRSEAESIVRASTALSLTLAGTWTLAEVGCIVTGFLGYRVKDDM